MTKFVHAGHTIRISEQINIEESSGFMRMIWNYGIDGVESATSYSTEKAAIEAAIELAERLPVVI
jgi:predicted component of type VI protein secretion system